MNLDWIDWSIIIAVICFLTYTAITTQKHTKSVADFLAANRCAGRYLLGTAEGMAAAGAVAVISAFELFYNTGFTKMFWEQAMIPIGLFITLSGWMVYRFRRTRAMTMGQFFEMRYSRKFRIFAGILAWVAGILNFGLFPSIGARFFINFCGFTNYFVNIGPLEINLTLAIVMFILIGVALYFTFIGGQIAILVTDFWQGILTTCVLLVIIGFLCFKFPWSQISEGLLIASKPGESLFDPMAISSKKDFNTTFFLIMAFFSVYSYMGWHYDQGYRCAAITPHEAKMGKVIGNLRGMLFAVGTILIPLVAITYMNHPSYANQATEVTDKLQHMFPDKPALRMQSLVPVAMTHFLPKRLIGLFAASMLCFFISTNNTQMHSWGNIFIQDVLCPLRKKPLSTKRHIWYLRCSIFGVAAFAFFFGLLFPLQEYIWMFMVITGSIYLGGVGIVMIGGLYWKYGSTTAAWVAMITGSTLSFSSIILRQVWGRIPFLVERFGPELPYNSQIIAFWCAVIPIVAYFVISLLGKRNTANLDKILHSGKYAIEEEEKEVKVHATVHKVSRFWRMIGVNSHEFSKTDKGIFIYTFFYAAWGFGSFIVLLCIAIAGRMSNQSWLNWWHYGILYVYIAIGVISSIWIGIFGVIDLRKMYKRLGSIGRNELDDGRIE